MVVGSIDTAPPRNHRAAVKRKCRSCSMRYPLNKKYFHISNRKNGRVYYRWDCRTCWNKRRPVLKGNKKKNRLAYQRARSRALRRLADLHRDEYYQILEIELHKERMKEIEE